MNVYSTRDTVKHNNNILKLDFLSLFIKLANTCRVSKISMRYTVCGIHKTECQKKFNKKIFTTGMIDKILHCNIIKTHAFNNDV